MKSTFLELRDFLKGKQLTPPQNVIIRQHFAILQAIQELLTKYSAQEQYFTIIQECENL
jgi:hypothetical protein